MNATEFTNWHKSTRSPNNNNCVEVGSAPGKRGIRDTKIGEASPVLSIGDSQFGTLIDSIRAGRFDR